MQKIKDYASEKAEVIVDEYNPNTTGVTGQGGDMYGQTKQKRINKYPLEFYEYYSVEPYDGNGLDG